MDADSCGLSFAVGSDGAVAGRIERLVLIIVMAVAACTDLRSRRIPNALVLVGVTLWVALWVVGAFIGASCGERVPLRGPLGRVASGFALAGASALLALLLRRWRGSPGLGGGDVKLLFVMGLYLGLTDAVVAVAAACVASAVVTVAAYAIRERGLAGAARVTFPFAPWLLLGCAVVGVVRLL